ncbi:uncharacterized protein C3orf38 homolog isoform X1 [Alosa sapidissima]|uniref:uncharacterized protein C3orf38 homolog isoform X1 n=1 Tax=Alosa sapidissima TaxID=34773 RepID=UPI001C082E9B|nr:uncharacterized protein C3orf38 homolog isoform X1 [Alosa sapidissima]
MSTLSKIDAVGCRKLLNLLSDVDLLALNDTVTNKMIAVGSTKEAIEAIITYSQTSEELLRRKKVHRDIIFKYLASEGVVMPTNSEKHQLVKATLKLWSSGKVSQKSLCENDRISSEVAGDGLSDVVTLGRQFSQWFFQLLNSQNPTFGQQPQEWGPQHFWGDVRLRLRASTEEESKEEFLGAELVSSRLQALSQGENLLFSPNLEPNGLRTISSPHGLVIVAVAGTIHRDQACLGIFEQVFGLIRSPLDENSWKIKFTDLKIRAQNTIKGTEELLSPALTYSSSELQLLCR